MDLSRPEASGTVLRHSFGLVQADSSPSLAADARFSAAEGSRKPGNWSMDPVMLRKTHLPTVRRKNMTHTRKQTSRLY